MSAYRAYIVMIMHSSLLVFMIAFTLSPTIGLCIRHKLSLALGAHGEETPLNDTQLMSLDQIHEKQTVANDSQLEPLKHIHVGRQHGDVHHEPPHHGDVGQESKAQGSSSRDANKRMHKVIVDLVVVLIKIFSAIILGYVCMRTRCIVPGDGDTKGLKFFVGNIAFPLLVFRTVATAKLGSIDFGVLAACSLAKVVIYWGTWIVIFWCYRSARGRGQRFLTATVFAFFTVASDDFATGFPVVNALYGSSMVVYIAANALVTALVMVPQTLVLFEIGKGLRKRDDDQRQAEASQGSASGISVLSILWNILSSPMIFLTCAGLAFQVCLGSWLVTDESGKVTLPEPLASIIDLWTGPFAMLALFSTGLSLTSASIHLWPMILVLLKLMVCGYLSYVLGLAFVYQEPKRQLQDFTFFYGSIPTSSAPLIFAAAFDPSSVELIASAVLFGFVLAGPNMFITALFLAQDKEDMMTVLNRVQGTAGTCSFVCAGLVVVFITATRRNWAWSGGLLALYASIEFFCGLEQGYIFHVCAHGVSFVSASKWELIVHNFLQKFSHLLLLYFQVCVATSFRVGWHKRWQVWIAWIAAAAFLTHYTQPTTMNWLCHIPNHLNDHVSNLVSNVCFFVSVVAILISCRSPGSGHDPVYPPGVASPDDSVVRHPKGVFKAICLMQGLRLFMYAVVNIDCLYYPISKLSNQDYVKGGRVQILILQQCLSLGGGVILFLAVLLQEFDRAKLQVIFEKVWGASQMSSQEPVTVSDKVELPSEPDEDDTNVLKLVASLKLGLTASMR